MAAGNLCAMPHYGTQNKQNANAVIQYSELFGKGVIRVFSGVV